jgi:hypothetical protein
MRLELQARPDSCVGKYSSAQEGGETDGLLPLVDASFEVGDRLCRDILCLIRWVGVRYAVGPSSVRDHRGMEKRGGRPHIVPVVSYCWMPSSDEHCPCGMRSAGSLEVYAEGRILGRRRETGSWGMCRIQVMIVQERALMVGETMRMVGRMLVSLRSCFR